MTPPPPTSDAGLRCATRHALGWLVFGNGVGLLLSLLLVLPQWQPGTWTYGHWVPLHLNAQLYGWTALPLVGWLLHIYEVEASRFRSWGPAMVWAWTAALASACCLWLGGETSGKIFLDWRNSSLWAFIAALVLGWIVLSAAWWNRAATWNRSRRIASLIGLVVLAVVPVVMVAAASPQTYPPVDPTTGGPTGSSLQGSTMLVIGLMLLLPRMPRLAGSGRAGLGTWLYFGFSWIVFAVTEAMGGGHFDYWQIGVMCTLLPWAWLVTRDWSGFHWPEHTRAWKLALLFWWAVLVFTAVGMYFPGLLDHIKFTQGLVAHSHLAMTGFTTSFCALLLSALNQHAIGTPATVLLWNAATLVMLLTLAALGWREGQSAEWMIVHAGWRDMGLILRALCGTLLLGASARWLLQFKPS